MIFTQKKELAKFLGITMFVLRNLIKQGEVITLRNDKQKIVGYCQTTTMIATVIQARNAVFASNAGNKNKKDL